MNNIVYDYVNVYDVIFHGSRYLTPHFQVKEFRCKDGSRPVFIHPLIPEVCELIRIRNGAFSPNSAYRTPGHNTAEGGTASSWHIFGRAVDIPAHHMTPRQMYDYLDSLYPDSMELILYSWGVHFGVQPNKSRLVM